MKITLIFILSLFALEFSFSQNNSYKSLIGKINTITEENDKVQIDIQIPEIKDSVLNIKLNYIIGTYVKSFEKENFPAGTEKPFLHMQAGYSGFKDKIVTFVFKTQIFDGSNSQLDFLIPFSFDIKNKKQIILPEIFKDSSYLKVISEIIIKKAKDLYIKIDSSLKTFLPDGLAPKPENFPTYYFDEDGIFFVISPLQIGTNAGNEFKIKVLYSEIKNILKNPSNLIN